MNQSLSASAGAGSLLGTVTGPAVGADAAAQGVVGNSSQTGQSFGQSMQQASQQHSLVSAEQVQGGQLLPEGGNTLPSVQPFGENAFPVEVVAQPDGSLDLSEGEGKIQSQLQQELFTLADKNFKSAISLDSDGSSALQQINQYRDADLSVMADSALKQMSALNNKPQMVEVAAESIANRPLAGGLDVSMTPAGKFKSESGGLQSAVAEGLVGSVVPVPVAGYVNQEAQAQSLVDQNTAPVSTPVSANVAEGETERQLLASVSVESKADAKPIAFSVRADVEPVVRESVVSERVESGLLAGAGRADVKGAALVDGKVLSQELPQASGMSKFSEEKPGNVRVSEPDLVKNSFSESVAQIVRSAGLVDVQPPVAEVAGSIEEAVNRLVVPTAVTVPEAKMGAETLKSEPLAKVEGSFSRVEPQLRSHQPEMTTQPPARQAIESAMQSGSALAGVQQVADNVRPQVKSGGDADKLKGVELTGRSEGRQETLLTGFADSLAAAGKVRGSAEPMQMLMPEGVRPGMPTWSQAVHNRVMMMASQNGQFAEIQLDPPELGSLQVKLQIKNEQISVVFNTPHGSVKEAIEQSLPRLREMLAEQGLDLAESSVHDQSEGRQHQGEGDAEDSFVGYQNSSAEEKSSEMMHQESLSLVDYYA